MKHSSCSPSHTPQPTWKEEDPKLRREQPFAMIDLFDDDPLRQLRRAAVIQHCSTMLKAPYSIIEEPPEALN